MMADSGRLCSGIAFQASEHSIGSWQVLRLQSGVPHNSNRSAPNNWQNDTLKYRIFGLRVYSCASHRPTQERMGFMADATEVARGPVTAPSSSALPAAVKTE
jgi:hypothetical protein